jgi:hypothetical protein
MKKNGMTKEIETGGPAFPLVYPNGEGSYEGMTLRDYFAAKAMAGELSAMTTSGDGCGGLSMDCGNDALLRLSKHWYRIADTMLEARK